MAKRVQSSNIAELALLLAGISDPRVEGRSKHLLIDVIVISICALLCGAESCVDFESFARSKEGWLRKFLKLPAGIPSHDTFLRLLSIVEPEEMEKIFSIWAQSIVDSKEMRSISLDGKSIQGTGGGFNTNLRALHVVNVYCHDLGLCLAQSESSGTGTGEAEAALTVMDCLNLEGILVMADAGLAIHRVAKKIREKKGHYLVPLKGNQRFYLERVDAQFKAAKKLKSSRSKDSAHGRKEQRTCSVIEASPETLDAKFFEQWPDLQTLIRVDRTREEVDKRHALQTTGQDGKQTYERNENQGGFRTTQETIYFLSSQRLSAEEAGREVRKHWGIENGLHWVLDVAFGEDDCLVRAKRASRNLSLIRKISFNLIRNSATSGSIKGRMKSAGWNNAYLEKIVFGENFDA